MAKLTFTLYVDKYQGRNKSREGPFAPLLKKALSRSALRNGRYREVFSKITEFLLNVKDPFLPHVKQVHRVIQS